MGQLEQFLSDIAPNGDWQPLIDYINQNYISKDKIRKIIKELEKEAFKSIAISEKINVLKDLLEEN